MTLLIGALDLIDVDDGYMGEIAEGGPVDGIPEVRGQRVLIPGRRGLYTPPTAPFEDEHLLIRLHVWVGGEGATHALRAASFATRFAALKTACDVAGREDVVITSNGYTISAGFLRFVGPVEEAREFEIEFDATDPPEWELTGS
jgi:hypothetical protein